MTQEWNEVVDRHLDGLEFRMEALEQRKVPRGVWVERVMYWLIIIGLVVAVIILALAVG